MPPKAAVVCAFIGLVSAISCDAQVPEGTAVASARLEVIGIDKTTENEKIRTGNSTQYVVSSRSNNLTQFPPGFKFGVATSAYQVEGAWNVSDKSESIWDRFTHTHAERIRDGSNGDISCNSYYNYKRDVQMIRELGAKVYRFSISWPRLLPTGQPDRISRDGLNYYNNLINELIANGIEPMITLYHWDLPQYLQDVGGWANPLISDWFADYARVVYSNFSDRVKLWITINEPLLVCDVGYATKEMAPALNDDGRSNYLCSKHILMAHAKAWRIYDQEFKPYHHGEVAIANLYWTEPETKRHPELTEYMEEFVEGRYTHPIYSKEGGWPPKLEKLIAEKSKAQGFPRSRLPEFTQEEKTLVQGTYDFIGVNHYYIRKVSPLQPGEVKGLRKIITYIPDLNAKFDGNWSKEIDYSDGFRDILRSIKNKYGDIKVFVTENGRSLTPDADDDKKIDYLKRYMKKMLLAIHVDKVNVVGYTVWSLLDCYEWFFGYSRTFGLYAVNFTDSKRPKTPRKSARYISKVIKNNSPDVTVD